MNSMACRNKIRATVDGLNKISSSYITSSTKQDNSALRLYFVQKLYGNVTRTGVVVVLFSLQSKFETNRSELKSVSIHSR